LFAENLRKRLSELAERHAKTHHLLFETSSGRVIIFKKDHNKNIHGNFLDSSYDNILRKENWRIRLDKPHPSFRGTKQEVRELDSCNSSDALLMNIFCHPKIDEWKSLRKLLDLSEIGEPEFGFLAKVKKNSGQDDTTEIDMKLDGVLVEAKLTEKDFTRKEKRIVESYDNFKKVFNEELLPQSSEDYLNYQVIRNILAAYERNLSFLLLCDARRPDLVKEFYVTARCVRDDWLRVRCNIVFWQEITQSVGKELRDFLVEKYGF